MEEVRASGVADFGAYLCARPEFVKRCMGALKVLDVNRRTLSMFGAASKSELLDSLGQIFRDGFAASFVQLLLDLWHGKTIQMGEVVNYTLSGEVLNIHLQFAVMAGYERSWERVLVSMVDITDRKRAEANLEYLGTHDSFTGLRNRAFYAAEISRVSRSGPWPVSVLALDMNGLKRVNDSQGHAAGDAMLRRVGDVLAAATSSCQCCAARIGGDEFVVLMPGADERMAQDLQARIESTLTLNNQLHPDQLLSVAIGFASCAAADSVEAAVHQADPAMFAAKENYYGQNNLERRLTQKTEPSQSQDQL